MKLFHFRLRFEWGMPPDFSGGIPVNVCSAVSYFSTLLGSIIGAGWLSFRVRDGSGRFPAAMAAVTLCKFFCVCPGVYLVVGWVFSRCVGVVASLCVVSFRPVSTSSLNTLRCV